LERQKKRLNPGDLITTLFANAATIFLSVVISMVGFLATETELLSLYLNGCRIPRSTSSSHGCSAWSSSS